MNGTLDSDQLLLRRSLSWVTSVVSAGAILSNGLVFLLFVVHRPLRTCSNALVASLASADFVFGVALLFSHSVPRREILLTPSSLCVFLYTLVPWSSLASPWSLMAITVDRYIYIMFPMTYNRMVGRKAIASVIVGIWVVSLGFALLALIPWPEGHRTRQICGDMITKTLPYMFIYLALVVVPCVIVTVLYCLIVQVARKSNKHHQELTVLLVPVRTDVEEIKPSEGETHLEVQPDEGKQPTSEGRDSIANHGIVQNSPRNRRIARTTKMFFYLTVIFFVLWLPLDVFMLVLLFCDNCRRNGVFLVCSWVSVTLYTFTPMINPWVYTLRNRDFRIALRKLMCCQWKTSKDIVYNGSRHSTDTMLDS